MTPTKSVQDLVQASGVAFGTSGARGLVTAMTDEVCYGYTTGFLRHLQAEDCWQPGVNVALAGDLRPSTPRILAACSAAIRDLGAEPEFCGFVPTPALAYHSMGRRMPAIMVTGSHIPDDRNGIKFYQPDGEILKDDEPKILSQEVGLRHWAPSGMLDALPPLGPARDITAPYIARYVDYFGKEYLRGMHIGVYQHSAVGRDVLSQLLGALGAAVIELGRSDAFVPVDTEAVRPEDMALARQWAADHSFDAIVSTDGDSDRPLVADEHGEWLRGDVLAMLCAVQLGMETVVTPVSSNTVVERCAVFESVLRTRIGSPYVIAAMRSELAKGKSMVCGYEANGGFLLGSDLRSAGAGLSALPTRDAVLPIIAVLAAARGSSLSQVAASLPPRMTYSARITDFASERSACLLKWLADSSHDELGAVFGSLAGGPLQSVDVTDGFRMRFTNDRIIHLRRSGNAPELRCYAEAEESRMAQEIADRALDYVSQRF